MGNRVRAFFQSCPPPPILLTKENVQLGIMKTKTGGARQGDEGTERWAGSGPRGTEAPCNPRCTSATVPRCVRGPGLTWEGGGVEWAALGI